MHALTNIYELEWHVNQKEELDSLLSDIWLEIKKEFSEASNSRRRQILGYLERISIFQPARTLNLVEFAINNPSKIPEDENLPSILQTTHEDIIYQIPSLLGIIAHHLKYLPRCCDFLWELGKDDQRETNRNPSHAIRVLSDLAKYDLDKDLVFNSTVLDCVEIWLKDPKVHKFKYSPLDILDQFLAKEETTEEYKRHQIIFYPFSVSYKKTKDIREKALTLLSECIKVDSTKAKLRTFKSLYDALWPPHGYHNRKVSETELDKWIPEQIEILEIIENLVKNTNDPIVHIQIYSDLKRVSRALKKDHSIIANNIADSIPSSFDLQITRALWDKYDKYEENYSYDYYEMQEKIESIKKQVVSELLKKFDNSRELFNYLERKLDNLEKSKVQYNPDRFFSLLGFENYKMALELCRFIISDPSCILSPYLSALMSGIRQEDKEEAVKLSKLALKTNEKKLIYSLAQGYAGRMWTSSLDDEDIELIKILLDHPDEDVKSLAIRSLGRFQDTWKPLAIKLALKIDIGDNEKLANALCNIFNENSIKIEELEYEDVRHILDNLVLIKELDHEYEILRFIEYVSSKYPDLVIELLFDRIILSTKEKRTWPDKYEPLPHEFRFELKIQEHPNYINILREVRNKTLNPNFSKYWLSKLFIEISNNISPDSLKVLYEWINSDDIEKLEAVASLIEHAHPDFVFDNLEFVSQLLDKAYSLNHDSYIKIRNRLVDLTNFRVRRSISGHPSPEDTKIRDQSKKIAEKLPKNSPTQKFYSLLYKNAEEAMKKPLFDEEEFD